MDKESLVEKYIAAWSRQSVTDLLALFHPGAAYYDAFWMETCVGKDLPKYFQDSFDEESEIFERVGDIIVTAHGVVFRYAAFTCPKGAEPTYYGADVLTILRNKILTVSDHYCDPSRASLLELADLAASRHGQPSHTKGGVSAFKTALIKAELKKAIDVEKCFVDSTLNDVKLAELLDCSNDHLSQLIRRDYGTDIDSYLRQKRVEFAGELLLDKSSNAESIDGIAAAAGFRSAEEFRASFATETGMTPREFRTANRQ